MADAHREALKTLCRTCGKTLKKDSKSTNDLRPDILQYFFIDISSDTNDVHPCMICSSCISAIRNCKNRGSTPQLSPLQWIPHRENCNTCKTPKRGRPIRKKQTGRPPTEKPVWTREILDDIVATIPNVDIPREFDAEINPHLSLCICKICNEVARKPLILKKCEHFFCSNCIIPLIQGRSVGVQCPLCKEEVQFGDLTQSTYVSKMIESLLLPCKNRCGEKFTVFNIDNLRTHETNCTFSSYSKSTITLDDIFSLDGSKEIPREIEDATLHVLKQKMKVSTEPNKTIKLQSGGPRVSNSNKFFSFDLDIFSYNLDFVKSLGVNTMKTVHYLILIDIVHTV